MKTVIKVCFFTFLLAFVGMFILAFAFINIFYGFELVSAYVLLYTPLIVAGIFAIACLAVIIVLMKSKKKTKTKEAQIRATDFFPEFTLYCFRHRRATDLYYLTQTGEISTKKAAALMGHSEIVFLKTYSQIDDNKENLARIYDGLKVENL